MEIFVLHFCLLYFQCNSLHPNDIPLLVYLFRLECTPYVTSTHVYICLRLSYPIKLLSLIVCFSNFSMRFSFTLSYTVLLVTLVHRNYISGSMAVFPFLVTQISLATIEYMVYDYCLSILFELSFMVFKPFFFWWR